LPKNEDGEFELVLANRQLLSVFFIVVILLGVFFTMGYIVGRNSTPAAAEIASTRRVDAAPLVVDGPARTADAAPSSAANSAPAVTSPQQPVTTEPQRAAAASAPEAARAEPVRAEPLRTESPKREPAKPVASDQPAAGQAYLQLAATSQHEAGIMVDVLRQKSFKAMAAEIPEKPGTFRVLVGPVTDASANKTRADLQAAGFPGNAAIRRTF
jgi:cell division septation protein DedD